MKIECLARREGGTIVQIGQHRYNFLPDDTGRHVADVTDKAHIAIFRLIPDGYRIIDDSGNEPVAPPPPPPPPKPLEAAAHEATLPEFPMRKKS